MTESFKVVSSTLLDKIDRLFACNVGDSVALPHIVVVGDQSSGKSSVLEGLTGLPFPRDSGLCTLFATQITFRRSQDSNINVSIIPAKNSCPQDREKLQGWKKSGLKSFDPQTFADIMAEVVIVMGVRSTQREPQKTFSNDVLRLEITGPNQEHFSVIDVPGIFRRTTHGLTTKEDTAMVTDMILEEAEDIDPESIRTFGILTKPSLVDKGSEGAIISLVEGRTHQLRLGWHLLRNPGQAELNSALREQNECEMEFFAKVHPWSTLDEGKVEIVSLRSRLQEVLEEHIRREFPKVKAEISQKLKKTEFNLRSLGPKR
ncbi:P-loop containing nucleoside triphosphate hydrolase protein [Dothidotthia symphoricarpi CBS 119687]|uniref:P-loop containing nucleoside triphosphate hydrolase protein n=1 Tax=Dothidotthia symphoricarpi CBS 119687 TaxID=1392245 RepID=A0A6A6A946_9PLEO|nr:P-loop containing nucleoside triphosphate hydrolase protein [Dothidotthia symphoricarpi CBS 119687]KAF2127181.1 P-loop containing nucleoside triphosphate hydrolase protein [Dothidotthia symphoricarpi CBS 119687]